MPTTVQITDALGGGKTLRPAVRGLEELRTRVLDGLPYGTFEAIAHNYGLDKKLLVPVLGVPARTLVRRKRRNRFRAAESDRLVRLARIAALAEEVLGSRGKAGRWLQKPNRALAGATPLELLSTELGARQIEQILGRIAHGTYS